MKSTEKDLHPILLFINRLDWHHRLIICLAGSVGGWFILPDTLGWQVHLMLAWIFFSLVYISLSWITFQSSHPADIRKLAALQDSSRTLVFLFVLLACVISLFTVILLMRSGNLPHGTQRNGHIIISIISVISSWWLVHTLYTFRYAHLFYTANTGSGKGRYLEGLQFPGEELPDYLDFVYFSFVLGMTFQVSDVTITSKEIRRLAWVHGVLSFAFNTVIVAFSINVIFGLIDK